MLHAPLLYYQITKEAWCGQSRCLWLRFIIQAKRKETKEEGGWKGWSPQATVAHWQAEEGKWEEQNVTTWCFFFFTHQTLRWKKRCELKTQVLTG